jgi:hypothetical protein
MRSLQQLYGLPHEEPAAVHTEKSPKPRRQTGRWMPEEVEALIEGEAPIGAGTAARGVREGWSGRVEGGW